MLLEGLTMENYGVYEDRTTLDFTTTPEKPIILVGGFNGAGKTTIFESLMVGLYGKSYLGRRTAKKEYSEFILSKLHRHMNVRADSASVEVSFRFYHNGCEDGYVVNRSWIRDGGSITESLVIKKNGEPMNDVDESQWQSFIEGLLPLGIARLFFFDGEKIVRMAKRSNLENDEIKSSLDMLLGADLINRLYSDLDLYMVRKSGKTSNMNKTLEKEYEAMRKEKDAMASEIEIMNAELEKKNAEILSLSSEVGIKESKIAGVGGGYADIRGNLLAQKAVLEEKTRHMAKSIFEDLGNDAPFYMIPSLLEKVKGQVESGTDTRKQREAASLMSIKAHNFRKGMTAKGFWPEAVDAKIMSEKIMKLYEGLAILPEKKEFFDLAPGDASWLLERIGSISKGSDALQTKIAEYGKTTDRLEKAESDLAKIPKDDELGPKISAINSLHQEIGILKSEVAHIGQEISSKTSYQRITQNKLKSLIDSIHKGKVTDAGVQLAAKMQQALTIYSENLRERKIRQLESNLLDSARSLLHKKYIHKIKIDRKTLEIMAYESEGDENPVMLKSMGEQQIVGTALLWAIAKTSGRSLPFVIDTPLGRLDGKHLSNLTDRFYPYASHQLILLSTDREIGAKECEQLSEHMSRSYRITCDEDMSVTSLAEGYFEVDN